MTFVCVICGLVGWRRDGRPVGDYKYPSWRCADSATCAARFLSSGLVSYEDYKARHADG